MMRRANFGFIALQEHGWRFWGWRFGVMGCTKYVLRLSLQDGDIRALDGSRNGIYAF